ncbi:MAG: hydroxyacylglutathione hydrolase [Pseudobdellovibrio sp.]
MQTELIPIFEDNYVFLIIKNDECVLVDPGEAKRPLEVIRQRNLKLIALLLTHHHPDHIGGVSEIKNHFPDIKIFAPLKNKLQISTATDYVSDGSVVELMNEKFEVLELAGHTLGHVAYYCKKQNLVFSGDVLFGLGCGRLFEGTAEQAFESLSRIKRLPKETLIYCTHEYTETNLRFCETVLKINSEALKKYKEELRKLRNQGLPSVPLSLDSEIKSNPFLQAQSAEVFAQIRHLRNKF